MPSRKIYQKRLLKEKKLEHSLFKHKIDFSSPISEHAAWVFKHIYSKPYQGILPEKSKGIARICHGMAHIGRAAIYAPIWLNLYRIFGFKDAFEINDTELKLIQIALLFHDAAREGEEKDLWELESGALLYFYLNMLGIEENIAIALTEATVNKDSHLRKYDWELTVLSSRLVWNKIKKRPINIYQIIIHDCDCLDILRARDHFDATMLFFHINIVNNELYNILPFPPLDYLAQLITEARSLIRKHGDHRGALQFEIKKNFEQENGFNESLKALIDSNYYLLPQLYNKGLIIPANEFKTVIRLPTQIYHPENGLEESNIKAAMREGAIFARGILMPSGISVKSKKTDDENDIEQTLTQIELNKSARRTQGKKGNPARSVCILFPGATVLYPTGYLIINPQDELTSSISNVDANTGWNKKTFFNSSKRVSSVELIQQKKASLINQLKRGGSSRFYNEKNRFPATYTEITYDIFEYQAIYFTQDPTRSNVWFLGDPEPVHEFFTILQALYLQQEYEKKHGKRLPIFEYSALHNYIKKIPEEAYSEEQIKTMWLTLCSQYISAELESNYIFKLSGFAKLSIEELKFTAFFRSTNGNIRPDILKKLALPDKLYSESFKTSLNQAITEVKKQLIWAQNRNKIDNFLVASNDLEGYKKQIYKDYKENRDTPLFKSLFLIAAQNGYHSFLELLLNLLSTDDDINFTDSSGFSPLMHAAQNGHLESLQLLIDKGANIESRSNQGFTALYTAVQECHFDCVKLLIQQGADPCSINNSGYSLLHSPFFGLNNPANILRMIQEIAVYFTDVNLFSATNLLPFHLAITKIKDETILEKLLNIFLNKGMNINQEISVKFEHYSGCFKKVPKYCLPKSLKNMTSSDTLFGLTFLHLAVLSENKEAVNVLLNHDAIVASSFLELNPAELANILSYYEISEIIKAQSGAIHSSTKNNKEIKNTLSNSGTLRLFFNKPSHITPATTSSFEIVGASMS